MKKIINIICVALIGAIAFGFGGFMIGYGIADNKAYTSVCNCEQTDILETIIEHDYICDIIATRYDYKNGTGYIVGKNCTNDNIYTFNVKVEKVAPFRYEWVEGDL